MNIKRLLSGQKDVVSALLDPYIETSKLLLLEQPIVEWARLHYELNSFQTTVFTWMTPDLKKEFDTWDDETQFQYRIALMEWIESYIGKTCTSIYHCRDWSAKKWTEVRKLKI